MPFSNLILLPQFSSELIGLFSPPVGESPVQANPVASDFLIAEFWFQPTRAPQPVQSKVSLISATSSGSTGCGSSSGGSSSSSGAPPRYQSPLASLIMSLLIAG